MKSTTWMSLIFGPPSQVLLALNAWQVSLLCGREPKAVIQQRRRQTAIKVDTQRPATNSTRRF